MAGAFAVNISDLMKSPDFPALCARASRYPWSEALAARLGTRGGWDEYKREYEDLRADARGFEHGPAMVRAKDLLVLFEHPEELAGAPRVRKKKIVSVIADWRDRRLWGIGTP